MTLRQEIEEKFDKQDFKIFDTYNNDFRPLIYEPLSDEIKNFIFSTVIPMVIEKIEKMKSGQKQDNGHDCYDKNCDYCENLLKDFVIDGVLYKLKNEVNIN